MIRNIQAQMELIQQQLNTLIQDNNSGVNDPKNNEVAATQSESRKNKENMREKEKESNTSIPSLEDA